VKRALRPDELKLWARVAATVRPQLGRPTPTPAEPIVAGVAAAKPPGKPSPPPPPAAPKPKVSAGAARPRPAAPPQSIEPGRMRRLTRERDLLGPRLDLHGMDQVQARAALTGFLRRAREDGWRNVLVITGKGTLGDGVLRRAAPEWLAEPGLRELVAGVSWAHRRHGGEGALYVALKRPTA
jgi:DNA-nicking Smr family endonuclease